MNWLSLISALAIVVTLAACRSLDSSRDFPDRELEHRQTRGFDPKPTSVDGGASKVTVYCNDGTRLNANRFDQAACADHSGLDYWYGKD